MARDPNAPKYPERWIDTLDDLKKLPPPTGTNKAEWDAKIAGGQYYANVKVYQDGRRVVEWYQRGVGGGPGQPDPVQATAEDIMPDVRAEWDKEEEKPPATRTINGVPHQVTGKDANGQDIWAPVQTTTGTATATTQLPADAVPRIEGTPMPDGSFDNEAPIKVWRRPDGTVAKTEVLSADERKKWDEDRQKSRNPGGKTDQQIKDEQTAAQTQAARPGTMIRSRTEVKDGVKRTIETWRLPDGTTEDRVAEEPAPKTPDRPRIQDPETKEWLEKGDDGTWRPIKTDTGVSATNEGPAPPRLEVGQVQTNLRDYLAELNKAVAAKTITPAERTRRWAEAIQQSTAALQEQQNAEAVRRTNVDAGQSVYAGGVNQRGQDVSMSNARLQAATTGFGQLTDAVGKANADLPVGSDAGGKAFAAGLDLQRWNAERMGGMVTPGAVAPPASLTTAAASPSPSPYPLVQAASSAMGAPPPAPVASVTGPGVPAAIPNTDQMASAEAARQAGMASAGAAPPPPIAAPAPTPAVAAPAMAAPAPAPAPVSAPPARDDWRTTPGIGTHHETGTAPPINLDPAQGPVGMVPPPMPVFSPGGTGSMPIVQAAQQAIAPPPGDSWEGTNQLLARLGIRPEAIAAARPMGMPLPGIGA